MIIDVNISLCMFIKIIYKLKDLPSDEEVYKIAEKWRPYRSIASRYIWEVVDQKINLT